MGRKKAMADDELEAIPEAATVQTRPWRDALFCWELVTLHQIRHLTRHHDPSYPYDTEAEVADVARCLAESDVAIVRCAAAAYEQPGWITQLAFAGDLVPAALGIPMQAAAEFSLSRTQTVDADWRCNHAGIVLHEHLMQIPGRSPRATTIALRTGLAHYQEAGGWLHG